MLIFLAAPGRNYLRVRGEYRVYNFIAQNGDELPPRARRIRLGFGGALLKGGTTSACAENTHFHFNNYL